MPSYQTITIYTAPAMFHVQGVLINTEEALDNVDWNPIHVYSLNMDTFTDIELVLH